VGTLLCGPTASGDSDSKAPEALRSDTLEHLERVELGAAGDLPLPEELSQILEWETRELALLAGLALLTAITLVVLLREMRGKGDLVVSIEVPPRQRGTFSVRLSKKRWPKRRVAEARRQRLVKDESRASTRFAHYMVARETQFRTIPARHYFVMVEGAIEDPSRKGSRTVFFEEREVRLAKGRTARLDFDLRPKQCPVEIRVLRGGEPAPQARVALGGDPTSLRYARSGRVVLSLPMGSHSILAGCEDRAAERKLEIESFEPRNLVFDMDVESELVFQDSPGAVAPFLQGDLSVAASALERDGQVEIARLLGARFHADCGEKGIAASQYESAGRLLEAGELRLENGEPELAAMLFERFFNDTATTEIYTAVGDLLRAGRAYEEAEDFESAIVCYRDAGAIPKLIDVLEKTDQHFEAAILCQERNDTSRAVRNYQHVDSRHPQYFEACRILADTFAAQGKLELAVQKADEAISFSRPGVVSAGSFVWYASCGTPISSTGPDARTAPWPSSRNSGIATRAIPTSRRGSRRSERRSPSRTTKTRRCPRASCSDRARAATSFSKRSVAAAWASSIGRGTSDSKGRSPSSGCRRT
jgi:hypothetical protein